MRIRRLWLGLAFLALALAVLPAPGLAEEHGVEVTLIHDTHIHGNFVGDKTNIAQKAAVIGEIRSRKPGALFVGSGDDLATSLLSGEFRGSHVVDAFNRMGLAVNTIGNHDFDLGPDNLVARVRESRFTWVSANLRDRTTGDVFGAAAGVRKYTIVTVNGVKVGFTGLAPITTPTASSPGPDLKVLPYAQALREVLPLMRQDGAQVAVVLSHICAGEAEALAAEVPGIDAFLGDHCAGALEQPKLVGSTIISRVGDEFKYVGELTLTVAGGRVTGHSFTRHTLTEQSPADPEIAGLIRDYQGRLDQSLSTVIGRSETPLDGIKGTNRLRETGLGNYVADVLRTAVGADVAILNGGNIRADKVYKPGPLTKKDIVEAVPFPNYIMKIEVTGAVLRQALEHGISGMREGAGRFPQVSGIRFAFDPSRPAGTWITGVWVNGSKLSESATYTLAVSNFIAGGGDGYAMFVGAPVLIDANSGPLISTAVMASVEKAGTIAPRPEGRIVVRSGVALEAGKAELQILGRRQPVDVAPEWQAGKLYAPVRWVAELFGADLGWNQAARTATVVMPGRAPVLLREETDGFIRNGRFMVSGDVLTRLGLAWTLRDQTMELSLPAPAGE